MKHAVILGAGFSRHVGLPLASEFTDALLKVPSSGGPSDALVLCLRALVRRVFRSQDHLTLLGSTWPELEDLYTFLDMSANTGHHLGFAPATLRSLRRALIVRSIRMLYQLQKNRTLRDPRMSKQVEEFMKRVDIKTVSFISTNWDVAVETLLEDLRGIRTFDYGCRAIHARFSGATLEKRVPRSTIEPVTILKLHGSVNWIYCDSCRRLFWCAPRQSVDIARLLLTPNDWKRLRQVTAIPPFAIRRIARTCPECGEDSLSTRFATFSYRKALDFPMFDRTWDSAEQLLREASSWTFIGYSLPAADYEFKHLLKRVQLSRDGPPKIALVTGGPGAPATVARYRKLFGRDLDAKAIFRHGLSGTARRLLRHSGVLA